MITQIKISLQKYQNNNTLHFRAKW